MSEAQTSNAAEHQDQSKPMDTRIALRRLMKLIYKEQVERRQELEKRAQITKWIMIGVIILALVVGSHMGSIIYSMNEDMNNMSAQMTSMEDSMLAMKDAMVPMADNVALMTRDMASMNGNFGSVRNDMNQITTTMKSMQYDTAVMRMGVTGMSGDTHDMSEPFRAMDDFIPW